MDYVRYLHSKVSVDDRALNLKAIQTLETHVTNHANRYRDKRLRVVEVGGGVGAMFIRLLSRDKLFSKHKSVEYTIIDVKQDVLLAAQENILSNAPALLNLAPVKACTRPPKRSKHSHKYTGYDTWDMHHATTTRRKAPVELCKIALTDRISVSLVLGDAFSFLKDKSASFDVLIAAAVMDLWEPEPTLKTFFSALDKKNGIAAFYFPINFDGTTDFFPPSSEGTDYDRQVENSFHRAMGNRKVSGYDALACHTGRRLIPCLKSLKATVKSAGGSTWTVSPDNGTYSDDEAFFLESIVDFIQSASDQFEEYGFRGSRSSLNRYLASRRKQISDGTLVYVAHNIDIFGVL